MSFDAPAQLVHGPWQVPAHYWSTDGYGCDVEDADLVQAIRSGDAQSWPVLVRRYGDLVWRVARAVVADDEAATDVMQVTWLKLLENLDNIREPAAIRGWLATTARREAIAQSKKAGRQRPSGGIEILVESDSPVVGAAAENVVDPADLVVGLDRGTILLEELERLGEKCRMLLTLYAHNFSYGEIAEILDIAPGGVSPSRMRCLEQLRRAPRIAHLSQSRRGAADEGEDDR